ncbi:sodium/solute symporter [Exilibacterium tricleocarpae]|uniref:Sodium/solute symporter n=1 Tax=Exilibacterium tricleocarpae TaxID=2591008 RepID=A0A545TVE0_9GAMM|nr:sodium:solute symporter [Exilibacterium tricleocarpae]TQV81189.1 sodium/solute symporter [Exilibacterium tricleocarpae]
MTEFGTLNWSILLVYILVNLYIGFLLGKKINSAEDFFLGDRSTPWWAIGISVLGTYVSALTFLGAPAWAYTDGLSVIAIHLNYPLVILLVVTFFLPFFFNSGVASIYEYQEKRFGHTSRAIISAIFLVSQALTSAAVLYATALVLEFITGIDVEYAIVIVTIIALVYTAMGGITAVIWTDVVQATILLLGGGIIFYALLTQLPLSLGETLAQLKAQGKTDPLNFSFDFSSVTTIWSGVIAMTLYHVTVYGTNQMMVQRTLAAKNIGDAKKSFMMMGFGAFFIYFMFILLGILFYHYYDGARFDNGNTIILRFATDYGLPGLMGIIAAAVLAASMSSLDSAFNSMATVSTIDFYQKYFKPTASGAHYLNVSRLFTVFWAIAIIVPAIVFSKSQGSILETLSKVGSYFVGAKLSMYALGFFSKHATEKGVLIGIVFGFATVWYVATQTDIAWPWFCLIGASVNIAVSLAASLLLDGRQAEYSAYTVKGQLDKFRRDGLAEKDGGWYLVPGRIDRPAYLLLVFFVLSLAFLFLFERVIA